MWRRAPCAGRGNAPASAMPRLMTYSPLPKRSITRAGDVAGRHPILLTVARSNRCLAGYHSRDSRIRTEDDVARTACRR